MGSLQRAARFRVGFAREGAQPDDRYERKSRACLGDAVSGRIAGGAQRERSHPRGRGGQRHPLSPPPGQRGVPQGVGCVPAGRQSRQIPAAARAPRAMRRRLRASSKAWPNLQRRPRPTANVSQSLVYKKRRDDADFARRWYEALAEGYDNLEMDLLCRCAAASARRRGWHQGKFDISTAFRCLAAHRESVAREKGRRTLATSRHDAAINAKIDAMRDGKENAPPCAGKPSRPRARPPMLPE